MTCLHWRRLLKFVFGVAKQSNVATAKQTGAAEKPCEM
jgi:hypothetical protein